MDFGEDRISRLPDDMLILILSFLQTRDIVASWALSTSWKSLRTRFTFLDFEFDSFKVKHLGLPISSDSIHRELSRIPNTPYIARIRKCRLHFFSGLDPFLNSTVFIAALLPKLLKLKVEEMDCSFPYGWRGDQVLPLLHGLFTSDSLTSLKLNANFTFQFPTSICFPSLKTLHLTQTRFQDKHSAEQLFAGCLVLEELLLDCCLTNYSNGITISNATLQTLTVVHYPISDNLGISSPNLQSFKLISCWRFKYVLHNLYSLTNAHVDVKASGSWFERVENAHCILKFLESIGGLLKSLTLSHDTLQTLSYCPRTCFVDHFPTLHNLAHLKVIEVGHACIGAALMQTLEMSPNLQSLDFPHGLDFAILQEEQNQISKTVPSCLKYSLKTFRVSNFRGDKQEVRFLKYILGNAYVLKSFSVHCSEELSRDPRKKKRMERELMQVFKHRS